MRMLAAAVHHCVTRIAACDSFVNSSRGLPNQSERESLFLRTMTITTQASVTDIGPERCNNASVMAVCGHEFRLAVLALSVRYNPYTRLGMNALRYSQTGL
jgi:hypothetical protein